MPTPTVAHGRASADWLALREPADAAARSVRLVDDLLPLLRPDDRGDTPALGVHDLGSGTGSQRRWLAPRLPWPQRWVEHDRDAALVTTAASREMGPVVEVSPCTCELAELTAEHLTPPGQPPPGQTPAGLVTASALLDVLTPPAVDRLVAAAAQLGVPLLMTLSVVGRVRLAPSDALDDAVLAAFNDHQRRVTPAGRLLGPDAVAYATERLIESGATVRTAPSPWRLGGSATVLTKAWFTGWLDAAVEQQPTLAQHATDYRSRRLAEIAAGRLEVIVDHTDLLAWWP